MGKSYQLKEKETGTYSFTLKDEAGDVVIAESLTSATLTLYEPNSGAIVNGRNAQSALNANNVTIGADGLVTWSIQLADVTILDATRGSEIHRALFFFSWAGGTKGKPHEVDLVLENVGKLA